MRNTKHDHQNPRPLPETIPLRTDLTGIDVAFPTASGYLHSGGAYLDYYEGQCRHVPREWTDRASHLFFRGGKLADLGIRIKTGLDPAQVMANIRWLMGSWEPKHEEKEATVGFALSQWCEVGVAQEARAPAPHQAQHKKKHKGGHRIRKSA